MVDYVLKPAERERLQVTVERDQEAPRASAQRRRARPTRAGMQQLLQKLAAKIDPGAHPRLQWIQATVGASIQMIPVEDVLFFISDEKYTRVQTATLEALIRKPIKELVDELDADAVLADPPLDARQHADASPASRATCAGASSSRVQGHPEKLEVSRSYAGLFKGM